MDNYPYSVAAFLIRRELESSMLNGDAHHSLSWELRYALAVVGLSKTRSPPPSQEVLSTEYRVLSNPDYYFAARKARGLPHI